MTDYIKQGDDTKAIGQLVMAFQMIESRLLGITVSMCMPGQQQAITAMASQLSFRKLAHAFSAIVATLSNDPDLKEKAQHVAGQLCAIEGERNKYIHSHYHFAEISTEGTRILRRKHNLNNLKQAYQKEESWFTTDQIDAVIASMSSVVDELLEIEGKLIEKGIIPTFDD